MTGCVFHMHILLTLRSGLTVEAPCMPTSFGFDDKEGMWLCCGSGGAEHLDDGIFESLVPSLLLPVSLVPVVLFVLFDGLTVVSGTTHRSSSTNESL
jgi:hypothetical protein